MKKFYNYTNPLDISEALSKAAEVKSKKLLILEDDKENKDEDKDDKKDDEPSDEKGSKSNQNTNPYFFHNIIFFTNDTNPKNNKTLKNLEEAIQGTDIELFSFKVDEIDYKATDNKIKFGDNDNKYEIKKQSNVDTIVIVRLGAQDSNECIELIKELQNWGFFVLNPIQAAQKASNKYLTSVLLERYKVPQPRFTLLSYNDIKLGDKSLNNKLKLIYKDIGENPEEDKKKEYVVKILNGHGGTGVFMVNGSTILSVLQTIFAIDPERELLLQKKENAEGGDIRIHVLTMRTEQKVLASMKRKKISGDFRSNVSLGATAEKVELTKEQEEIALKVAKISGMPWCAVDIMPLKAGSNPEVGDNVVLEYNSSPGTEGISEVIGENFIKILLDNINDINQLVLAPKAIGYIEDITFTFNNEDDEEKEITFECKLDTGNGAKASTIGCDKLDIRDDEITATIDNKIYKFKRIGESNAKVGQVVETRQTVLIPCLQMGSRKLINAEFALVDNRKKKQRILINRDIMSKMGYMINPSKKHILKDQL